MFTRTREAIRLAAIAPAAAIVLLATVTACRTDPGPVNVVLITIDTLRAGNLSAYGHSRPTSPRLDQLAQQGVLFEHCYSAANVTTPSHTSILTGTRVPTHGVWRNSSPLAADGVPTLAERFRQSGYATAAVVSIDHLNGAQSGLGRGFESYFDAHGERRAEASVRLARTWIATNSQLPFFLWLHVFDPHMPYNPPPPYDGRYVTERSVRIDPFLGRGSPRAFFEHERLDDGERKRWEQLFTLPWNQAIGFNRVGLTPAELEYLPALYDGEVSYTDAALGELLDDLDRHELSENTLVAVTADHGEQFGRHGLYFVHRTLYEETLHVPLILRLPDRIPAGRRIATPVSGIDVSPTVLDYAGLPLGDQMDGRSLARAISGSGEPAGEPILAEHGNGRASMVRDGPWKLIVSSARRDSAEPTATDTAEARPPRPVHEKARELFNLADDPYEQNDVAAQHPEIVRRLLDLRATRLKRWAPPARPIADPAAIERLRALGYTD